MTRSLESAPRRAGYDGGAVSDEIGTAWNWWFNPEEKTSEPNTTPISGSASSLAQLLSSVGPLSEV